MKRFLLSLLLTCSIFTLSPLAQAVKPQDLLQKLLDLPSPATVSQAAAESDEKERPEEFYRWKNMPPDDAPLEDLLAYWKGQRYQPHSVQYDRKASPKVAGRLMEHLKEHPEKLFEYLGAMPTDSDTTKMIRDIRDEIRSNAREGAYSATQLDQWLQYNTADGVENLTKLARKIKDRDNYVSNENQAALRSLAKLDWEAARPHVERLEFDGSQPYSQTLAHWARYEHAIAAGDSSDTETYRKKLQKVVEDRAAAWAQRDLAMDALVAGGDWDGRDEWYVGLFADETLLAIQDNGYTGMTTMLNASEPGKWKEKMLKLAASNDKNVRTVAARNLMHSFADEKEIVEALLPWLTDAGWAKESRSGERAKLITALGTVDLPMAVPTLIAILSGEEEFIPAAAKALALRKDFRAVPGLKAALAREDSTETRSVLIEALAASGGFSDDEQMSALEAYAAMISTEEGLGEYQRLLDAEYDEAEEDEEESPVKKPAAPKTTLPVEISIGQFVALNEEPGEGLAVRAIEREKALRKTNPDTAKALAEIMRKWKGRPMLIEMLRRIGTGQADVETVITALAQRKLMREKVPNEVSSMRSAAGTARGTGACIAENESEYLSIIGTGDLEARTAMFACARLIRAKLPITEVAAFLNNANKLAALSAERYLESEDSVRARTLVLAKYPGETRILGAHQAFVPDPKSIYQSEGLQSLFQSVTGTGYWLTSLPNLRKHEAALQTEMKQNPDLIVIYARLPEAAGGQQVVRVFKDKIRFTFYEDDARYSDRDLTPKEYKAFHDFIVTGNIDGLQSTAQMCHHGCPSSEFIMFGRNGGRRAFFSGYEAAGPMAKLDEFFEGFRSKGLKLNYRLAEKIKGLEVILADDKFPVYAVWKKNADLRFLTADTAKAAQIQREITEKTAEENAVELEDDEDQKLRSARWEMQEKRRQEAFGQEFSWRMLENGKMGPSTAQPDGMPLTPAIIQLLAGGGPRVRSAGSAADSQHGIIYANRYENGLYKLTPSGESTLIKDGQYDHPVASPDGKWVVAAKADDGWEEPYGLARINLQTGREFKVNLPSADLFYPLAFLPVNNKFLVYRGPPMQSIAENGEEEAVGLTPNRVKSDKPNPTAKTAEYYLLDVSTGVTQKVTGEFRPITDPTFRPLQATEKAGESWAAVYDANTKTTRIGRYTEKTFVFKTEIELPEISVSSMDMWVDGKEGKIYFVYRGHLLAVPMNQPLLDVGEKIPPI